jgi:hypothetical protein
MNRSFDGLCIWARLSRMRGPESGHSVKLFAIQKNTRPAGGKHTLVKITIRRKFITVSFKR